MDSVETLPARSRQISDPCRAGLCRNHRKYSDRQGALLSQRRAFAHAHPQGPAAAGSEIFSECREITAYGNANEFVQTCGGQVMACTGSIGGGLLAAALMLAAGAASAFDDANYPNWKGQWHRLPVPGITGAASFDPNKRLGREQQAPLTVEYQKVFEDNLAEQAAG